MMSDATTSGDCENCDADERDADRLGRDGNDFDAQAGGGGGEIFAGDEVELIVAQCHRAADCERMPGEIAGVGDRLAAADVVQRNIHAAGGGGPLAGDRDVADIGGQNGKRVLISIRTGADIGRRREPGGKRVGCRRGADVAVNDRRKAGTGADVMLIGTSIGKHLAEAVHAGIENNDRGLRASNKQRADN